jgi:hypothetical protein
LKLDKKSSIILKLIPPSKKPITAGIHGYLETSCDISIAGAKSDQKLAAIITPAAKPSIISSVLRFKLLNMKTIAEPSAVTNNVKHVAKKA